MHIEIQNCFSFWGTSSPDPLPGLRPWTPLGDFCPPVPLHRTSPHILYQVYAPVNNDQIRHGNPCEEEGLFLVGQPLPRPKAMGLSAPKFLGSCLCPYRLTYNGQIQHSNTSTEDACFQGQCRRNIRGWGCSITCTWDPYIHPHGIIE